MYIIGHVACYIYSYIASSVAAISPLHFNPGLVVSDALVQNVSACSNGMLFSARAALLGVVCAFGWNIAATARHLCFLGAVSACPPVQGICILYIHEPGTHLQCLGCLV
jgi:hypothetical protein